MKYGQQFAEALSSTSEEFQQASIDYKQLKKSIKRIEKELQALGLNAEILRELLSSSSPLDEQDDDDDEEDHQHASSQNGYTNGDAHPPALKKSGSGRSLGKSNNTAAAALSSPQKVKRKKRRQARARAEYELSGTVDNPIPRIKLVFSSESSGSDSSVDQFHHHQDDLYTRLLRADSAQIIELEDSDDPGGRLGVPKQHSKTRSQTTDSTQEISSEDLQSATSQNEDEGDNQNEKDQLIDRMYGRGILPADKVTPPGSPETIRQSYMNGHVASDTPYNHIEDEGDAAVVHGPDVLLQNLSLDDPAEDGDAEGDGERHTQQLKRPASIKSKTSLCKERQKSSRPRRHRREIVINLEYDSEFFALLNQALSALTELMTAEKASFMAAVKELAAIVTNTASPSKNKTDLYAWREVFSLWVEAEIFEGEREMDRGERGLQEIERRLKWFVDQVGRRKLAKKMKSKDSRRALERFVSLNQELLQLKRIGLANQEAARKILKKHDKRLGLSASQDFPGFVAQHKQVLNGSMDQRGAAASRVNDALSRQSAIARTASSNEMSSLIFVGLTTLPHALLTMFTDILLPIIPQIDDYSCIICSDIAWKPIALDCGHRFCVRCLVKMQKRGQDACPACRAPVVLKASKENLDNALMSYQKTWFPKEIKQKQKDDTKEIEKEYAHELEINAKCLIM